MTSCLLLTTWLMSACGDSNATTDGSTAGSGGQAVGVAGTSNAGTNNAGTSNAGTSNAGTSSAGSAGEDASGAGGSSGSEAAGAAGEAGSCDPDREWSRDYKASSPAACQAVKFACPEHTERFANECGCGCEQSPDCTKVLDCVATACAEAQALCPYSALPR